MFFSHFFMKGEMSKKKIEKERKKEINKKEGLQK